MVRTRSISCAAGSRSTPSRSSTTPTQTVRHFSGARCLDLTFFFVFAAHKNLFGIERGSDMLVFLCNGDEEKNKWLRALRDLVKTFQKKAFKSGAAAPKEP